MKIVCALLVIGIYRLETTSANLNTAAPIQIVAPVNHTFHLKADVLKTLLESDELKDRQVVVVSIAGVFRQGKSFLLNFFLKYLNAQVNKI